MPRSTRPSPSATPINSADFTLIKAYTTSISTTQELKAAYDDVHVPSFIFMGSPCKALIESSFTYLVKFEDGRHARVWKQDRRLEFIEL